MAKTRTTTRKKTVAPTKAKSRTTARKNATDGHAAKARTTKKAAETGRKKLVSKKAARNEPAKEQSSGDKVVTVDRRTKTERRANQERRTKPEPVAVERRSLERRAKVNRRRQIDPTTCERDYSGEELEFMNALDAYKRSSGRMFPTCSEILEVVRGLGYRKVADDEQPNADCSDSDANDSAVEEKADLFPSSALFTTDGGMAGIESETFRG